MALVTEWGLFVVSTGIAPSVVPSRGANSPGSEGDDSVWVCC